MGGGFFDVKKMKNEFKRYQDDQHHSRVIKDVIYGQPITNASHAEETLKLTEKIRKQVREQDPYPIMKHEFEEKSLEYIFYQVAYSKILREIEIDKVKEQELKFPYDERNMLIVMCHGFQGTSFDMRILQRGLKEVLPNAEYLLSQANEFDTETSLSELGFKLAK